ncbi:hypothetical protein BDW75DRAFT_235683 [Aspergillus navahoensis]
MAEILRKIFIHKGYYGIARAIMTHSTASATAALLAALRVHLSSALEDIFLHPLRDVDHTMQLFESWPCEEYQILIVGPDSGRLQSRIKRPEKYYLQNNGQTEELEVWIVAIPHGSQNRAPEVDRLQRVWNDKRRGKNSRGKALVEFEIICDKSIIRQCADEMLARKGRIADVQEMDLCSGTVRGDNIRVKWFNLLLRYRSCLDRSAIRLEFRGLSCCLPWDLSDSESGKDYWKPEDGIPYIDTASPFSLQRAARGRGHRQAEDNNLVFYSMAPEWCPMSPVLLPISPQ